MCKGARQVARGCGGCRCAIWAFLALVADRLADKRKDRFSNTFFPAKFSR